MPRVRVHLVTSLEFWLHVRVLDDSGTVFTCTAYFFHTLFFFCLTLNSFHLSNSFPDILISHISQLSQQVIKMPRT